MLGGFHIGSIFGFPVRVNFSFLALLGVVVLSTGAAAGLLLALTAAGSVLLHELGHAVVARRLGVRVSGIELNFFGGAAQMGDLSARPGREMTVAVAGPAVSFALAGAAFGLAAVVQLPFLSQVGWVNFALGAFNLLPAFPSDGGRILRAWFARSRGLVAGTDLAVKVGRWVCAAMAIAGLAIGSFQLVLVAVVLWTMGGAERFAVRLRAARGPWEAPIYPSPSESGIEYIPPPGKGAAGSQTQGGFGPGTRSTVFVWRR